MTPCLVFTSLKSILPLPIPQTHDLLLSVFLCPSLSPCVCVLT